MLDYIPTPLLTDTTFVNKRISFPLFRISVVSAYNLVAFCTCYEPGSSVSVVSGYGLDNRANEVRSPVKAREFFLQRLCPDRFWGPPSLLYNGYRGFFPGGKARPGRDADHTPPSTTGFVNE
jgi:hypothetical protein